MPLSLATVDKGHRFAPVEFEMSHEWVRSYVDAVQDQAIVGVAPYTPPMSLVALAIRSLLDQSQLPPGSIHAAQEISFLRPVAIGERLCARAEVLSRGERQGWVMMGVGLAVLDAAETIVMNGRSTITFPVAETDTA